MYVCASLFVCVRLYLHLRSIPVCVCVPIHTVCHVISTIYVHVSSYIICSFLSALESTKWLLYISQLLSVSLEVVTALDKEEVPVLVHCSDGWDRTPQVVTLAKIILDPYYRTIEVSVAQYCVYVRMCVTVPYCKYVSIILC